MAIYDAGYLSPIKNKLGNAVGRRWRNLNVLSVYNGSPRNPRTRAQQLNRTRFSAISGLAMAYAEAIGIGFKPSTSGSRVPPRGMFIRKNWDYVHAEEVGSATVDYDELAVSAGSLTKPIVASPTFTTPYTVSVTQEDTSTRPRASADDKVIIAVYSPESFEMVTKEASRTDASIDVAVPDVWVGQRVHVYAFAVNADITRASDSSYIGSGTIN